MKKLLHLSAETILLWGLFIASGIFAFLLNEKLFRDNQKTTIVSEDKVCIEAVTEELCINEEAVYKFLQPSEIVQDNSKIKNENLVPPKTIQKEETVEKNITKKNKPVLENKSERESFFPSFSLDFESICEETTLVENCKQLSIEAGYAPTIFGKVSIVSQIFETGAVFSVPCVKVCLDLSEYKNTNLGIGFQAQLLQIQNNKSNYLMNADLKLSSLFFATRLDFIVKRPVLSAKNLLEIRTGIGVTGFVNCYSELEQFKTTSINAFYFSIGTGISYRHYFSKNFFSAFNLDINYAFPFSQSLFFLQPSITGGFLI